MRNTEVEFPAIICRTDLSDAVSNAQHLFRMFEPAKELKDKYRYTTGPIHQLFAVLNILCIYTYTLRHTMYV